MNIKSAEVESIIKNLLAFHKPLNKEVVSVCNRLLMFEQNYDYNIKGDAVVVAGYPRCLVDRAPLAFELLSKGTADLAILSGGAKIPNTGITESEAMLNYLLNKKIDKNRVLVENKSKTTIGNAYFSSLILKGLFTSSHIKLIVLTSNFHQRRFMLALKKSCESLKNKTVTIIPMPSASEDCKPESWPENIIARAIVAREIQILEKHIKSNRLPSFNI